MKAPLEELGQKAFKKLVFILTEVLVLPVKESVKALQRGNYMLFVIY